MSLKHFGHYRSGSDHTVIDKYSPIVMQIDNLPAHIAAGIAQGTYKFLIDHAGKTLPIIVNSNSNKIVYITRLLNKNGAMLNPLLGGGNVIVDLITTGMQTLQVHRGFQKTYGILGNLQSSVGSIQATTALLGVGSVATVALSAASLYQMLKIREDIQQLQTEVRDGFIDLKQALKDQGEEILSHIDMVSEDVEFRLHKTILSQAYAQYIEALRRLKDALIVDDIEMRNSIIIQCQGMLHNALASYNNPELCKNNSAPGSLRRKECSWAIEQTIALSYQYLGQYEVSINCITLLRDKINKDIFLALDQCHSSDELEFLFPEITRICEHDLVALEYWENHIEWLQSLSPGECKQLFSPDVDFEESRHEERNITQDMIPELTLYKNLEKTSSFNSLRDQLKLNISPGLRLEYESFIVNQSKKSSYHSLVPSEWKEISNQMVSNLYWYFKHQENQDNYV
jgi:tetratricopeptide (TPR) repeat protein